MRDFGGPLLIFISTIAVSHNTPLPPEMRYQNYSNNSSILILVLFYFLISLAVNLVGLSLFVKRNHSKHRSIWKVIKFSIVNLFIFIAALTSSILITALIM